MAKKKDGFWRETGKKVIKRQRMRAQGWFVRHPMTFGATWGLVAGSKGLFWTLPKWGYGKATGRPKKVKEAAADDGLTTTTVTETMDSAGNISTSTRTTTTTGSGAFAMGAPQQVGSGSTRPTLVVVDPIERTQTMASSDALLRRSPLGRAFIGLAGEIEEFVPVHGAAAQSTVQMVGDAYLGFKRIALSVDTYADVVADLGLHRRIVEELYHASAAADALDQAMRRANTQTVAYYDGQIEQESSGALTLSATPVPVGAGVDAEGIAPFAAHIARHYESFDPPVDAEATAIYEYLRTSQAGFARLSDALTGLAQRLRRHGVDARIRRLIRSAGGDALAAAGHFQGARQIMSRLYKGQMAQESSGVTTIRTAPMSQAS